MNNKPTGLTLQQQIDEAVTKALSENLDCSVYLDREDSTVTVVMEIWYKGNKIASDTDYAVLPEQTKPRFSTGPR